MAGNPIPISVSYSQAIALTGAHPPTARRVGRDENFNESAIDDRVRLDPLDPKTSHHAGECEFASETDPSVLRVLLKVKPGMGGDYSWDDAAAASWVARLRTTPRASGDETWEAIPMKSVVG